MLPRLRPASSALVAGALVALLAGGCALGERPSLDRTPTAEGTMTGDAAIDVVLTKLDGVSAARFNAHYTAQLVFSGTVTELSASQAGSSTRRSVTIGDIRYVHDGAVVRTCTLSTRSCTDGVRAEAVSNTGVTPEFAFGDLAKRLRRDAVSQIGPGLASTEEVAGGGTATCVSVPLPAGTSVYCVLDDGVITRFTGGDVVITISSYGPDVDESQFSATPA